MLISKTIKNIGKVLVSVFVISAFILPVKYTIKINNDNLTIKININQAQAVETWSFSYVYPAGAEPKETKYTTLEECEMARTNFLEKNLRERELNIPATKCTPTEQGTISINSKTEYFTLEPIPAELQKEGVYVFSYTLPNENPQESPEYTKIESCTQSRKDLSNGYKDRNIDIKATECVLKAPKSIANTNVNTQSSVNTNTKYTLLAPLPGLEGGFESDPNKNPCAFGKYMNMMIKIILGIAAVLAMIMIIKGGFEYMASSLPSGKESGKGTITQAILGLIIALGAYLILFTINPNLLNFCLDEQLPKVELTIQDDVETPMTAQTQSGICPVGSTTTGCKEGITEVSTTNGGKFCLCKTIASSVQQMVNLAWQQNPAIQLSGGSFRTKQQQEAVRAQNCGGSANIYNQNAKCNPLTAYPGTSRHESGLAVDFTCNGTLIQDKTNSCFIWLTANAKNYQLKNLIQETWHWSTDGR